MKIIDVIQGTPEWHTARLGRVTASRVSDVMAMTKSGPSASRTNYKAELIAERLTQEVPDSFTNAAMQWGTDHEPEARAMYEFARDIEIAELGFVVHPTMDDAGASPDGLVGDEGMIEIKCPNTATHIRTLLGGSIAGNYFKQMQFQMACSDRLWCDFVSYDPRLPAEMAMHIQRVNRDDTAIAAMEASVKDFIMDVTDTVAELTRRFPNAEAAE